ncbi:hypothetical protein KW790_00510 [Candidatus Parcubacteria bacterium]|nr:hypothetical protein [Candidatus Parcubacteria bacterium]
MGKNMTISILSRRAKGKPKTGRFLKPYNVSAKSAKNIPSQKKGKKKVEIRTSGRYIQ